MHDIRFKNCLLIVLGAALFSFGFVNFIMQNALSEGGFSGITLILYFSFGWDVALMNLLLNIPMFIIGWRMLGKRVFIYTLLGTVSVSVFLKLFHFLEVPLHIKDDLLLAALFAGLFVGLGLGIIFRYGGTTGGSDIVARVVYEKYGWSMGKTMFLIDAFVILLSWLTFLDARTMMYTLVAVFVGSRVIDFVQDGAYAARGIWIVSQKKEEIADAISRDLHRGVTVLHGHGHYTGEQRELLYIVVSSIELMTVKNLISEIDPTAFVSVTEVHDVMGEGFTLDEEKRPIVR